MNPPKTVQALKIAASWTPAPLEATAMMAGVFDDTPAEGVRFTSGRLALAYAIAADFGDPVHAQRVARRAAEIRAVLERAGELHDFRTTAGRVPVELAEVLPDEPATPAAEGGA